MSGPSSRPGRYVGSMSAAIDPATRTRRSSGVLVMLMGATVALNAGNGAIFALTAEIQKAHGFTTSELGYITGALFLSMVISLLTLSHLADRGHSRAML